VRSAGPSAPRRRLRSRCLLDKGPVFEPTPGWPAASTVFTGTPRGDCVLEKYRAVHVPPFKGAPISVGKSFLFE
jgi:hypothetical protein